MQVLELLGAEADGLVGFGDLAPDPHEGSAQLANTVAELLGAAGKLGDAPNAAKEVLLVLKDVGADGGLYSGDVRGHTLIICVCRETRGGGGLGFSNIATRRRVTLVGVSVSAASCLAVGVGGRGSFREVSSHEDAICDN